MEELQTRLNNLIKLEDAIHNEIILLQERLKNLEIEKAKDFYTFQPTEEHLKILKFVTFYPDTNDDVPIIKCDFDLKYTDIEKLLGYSKTIPNRKHIEQLLKELPKVINYIIKNFKND